MIPVRILYWMILLGLFLPEISNLLHSPGDTTFFERHLLKGIVNISVTYFTSSSPLVIVTADSWHNSTLQNKLGDSLFRDIHSVTNGPVLTFSINRRVCITRNTTGKYGAVILLLNEQDARYEEHIFKMLLTLLRCPFWNPRARYVVVSTAAPTSRHGQNAIVVSILKYFSSLNILNVIFLIQKPVQRKNSEISSEALSIEIFTVSQHSPGMVDRKISDIPSLDRWVNEEGRTRAGFRNNAILFRSQPITDLRGRNETIFYGEWPPLVMSSDTNDSAMSTQHLEGIEVRLMKTVAEHTNFTFDFRSIKNYTPYHGYFGAQWLQINQLYFHDATRTHFTGAVTWFVPRERAIPRWQSLIKIFNPSFWLLVFLAYVLGSFTFWILGNTQSGDKETASFRNIILIFLNVLSMMVSESVCKKPKHTGSQIFFLLWSVYCLLINNAYQSSLIGFLANPGNLPRINDLDNLLESGLELGIQNGIQEFFSDALDPRNKRILKSYVECNEYNYDLCLKRMAYEGNLAVAGGRIGLEFLAHTKYMKDGKPLYVPFKDNIQQGYMVIYLPRGSILLERINSIVLRLQNAGIIDKWVNDIRRKFGKHFDKALPEDDFCVLTLAHLEGAFYLLLLGMLLSTTVWFLEIIHHFSGHGFIK
jgi:Ligand-gated ion channel.